MEINLFVDTSMKTLAYLRVSTHSQNLDNQRLAILNFAQQEGITISDFIEVEASSQKTPQKRRLDEVFERLNKGDRLIVSELSRLGRSLGKIIAMVDALVKKEIHFTAIKEAIHFEGKQDMQTKVMITLFALFAEIERDLISERTKEGLAKARASGKQLGRPKGSFGYSKLDGREEEIRSFLSKGVSKSSIAKITGVSRTTILHFIKTRQLMPK